ncbi:hypothetical protein Tco_0973675 [Tanacetum coccineum]
MAVLESCPKHNMVAYLEKTEGNAEFHEIIDFLTCISIHHALTISLVVSTTFVEQFWMSTKSKIINNVRHITAKVAGKPVSISEASIRSDLLFNDADGIDSLPNQAIFDAIQLMGYEGDLTVLTFNKAFLTHPLRPSPSTTIPDSIPESSGGNHGGQSSSDKSLSVNEGDMTLQSVYDLKKFIHLPEEEKAMRSCKRNGETEKEGKRLAEEKATNDALIRNYDDIKARIKADRLLAERLQEQEREQFIVEERAKFLHDTITAQRKFLAQQRSEAIRNRPPTKNQLRNQMMTYLKHVGNYQHSQLKTKKFEEIQALYEKIKRSYEDFIIIGSAEDERMIREMNEKGIDSSKNVSVKEEDKEEEGTKKIKSCYIKMITRKKPRKQSDDDSDDEHRKCLKIVTFEATIDSEIMEKKSVIARLNKVSSPDGDDLVIYKSQMEFQGINYLIRGLHIFDSKIYVPFILLYKGAVLRSYIRWNLHDLLGRLEDY